LVEIAQAEVNKFYHVVFADHYVLGFKIPMGDS